MDRTAQDEALQNECSDFRKVLEEEKAALETWMKCESVPSDVFEGMQISWNKIAIALKEL